jgi:ABC-type molybdate transport system substrate-binding protein
MNRKAIHASIAVFALMAASVTAFAHNGIEHVMGTLTARTDSSVTVETPKHATVTVLVDSSTKYNFNDTDAALKDLKVGDRVVVNAKEATDKKLLAISVRWGAGSTAKSDHADHHK